MSGTSIIAQFSMPLKFNEKVSEYISVVPITQYTHVCNKNSNTQGNSPRVVKEIFHTLTNNSKRKELAPSGSKFFSLREVPTLKRDVLVENNCLIQ